MWVGGFEGIGRLSSVPEHLFLTVDPQVAETGQPYAYAGDDPTNGTDPLGLCWPSWACGVEHAVGGAFSSAGHWVAHHYGTLAELAAGGACIVVSAGTCAIAIGLATGVNLIQQYTNGTLTPTSGLETLLLGAAGAATAGIGGIMDYIGNQAVLSSGELLADSAAYPWIRAGFNALSGSPFDVPSIMDLLNPCP